MPNNNYVCYIHLLYALNYDAMFASKIINHLTQNIILIRVTIIKIRNDNLIKT